MAGNYQEEANKLAKAIDIAIESFQKYPPKGFQPVHVTHMIKTYEEFKEKALTPEEQFKNLKSLKYLHQDTFTYFQESTGEAVEYFWKQIKQSNLPYTRENKLLKILSKNKIKNQIEYDYVKDMIGVAQQEGLINKEELYQLNELIKTYEAKKRR
jgi:hypothetical protein